MLVWSWAISPGASLIAGLIALAMLVRSGRHLEPNGDVATLAVVNSVISTAMLYTIVILVIGEFFVGSPVSQTVKEGFGDKRMGWLLVPVMLDYGVRVWSMLRPKAPAG